MTADRFDSYSISISYTGYGEWAGHIAKACTRKAKKSPRRAAETAAEQARAISVRPSRVLKWALFDRAAMAEEDFSLRYSFRHGSSYKSCPAQNTQGSTGTKNYMGK